MATFYYNHDSSESINSQWRKHLQNQSYIGDIASIVSYNRQELQATFQNASSEHLKAISNVCGKIDDGFKEATGYLKNINFNISELRGEINEMASMLDWKLSQVIEEQRVTNYLLGKIAKLLRIPDSQKQRVYYIEQGLKYLKNAFMEDFKSDFYVDAFESFQKAEEIEKKDYLVLNRMGQIYLYSEGYLDIGLAEQYFLKSAREATAEANAGGTTVSNSILPLGKLSIIYSENPFKADAAEAYLYAGRACYLQNKLPDAIDYSKKAFNMIPEFCEAGFELSKYLAAYNKEEEAVKILEEVITKDRLFSLKALKDYDLYSKPRILKLLKDLQVKTISAAKMEFSKCNSIIQENSAAKEVIEEIERNISKDSFLGGMKALDLLTADYNFSYKEYSKSSYSKYIECSHKSQKQKLRAFLNSENNSFAQLNVLKEKCRVEIMKEEILGIGGLAAMIGFGVGFIKGCNTNQLSEDWGGAFTTSLIFGIGGALIGYFNATSKPIEIK